MTLYRAETNTRMDEQAALTIGTMAGAMIAAMGVVFVIGWKVWQALKKMLPRTAAAADDLDELLGARESSSDVGQDGPRARRKTGTFQTLFREELEHQLKPIERSLESNTIAIRELTTGQRELAEGQRGQAELIAELSRSHGKVATRTAEHSAALNIAKAEQSTTAGSVPG